MYPYFKVLTEQSEKDFVIGLKDLSNEKTEKGRYKNSLELFYDIETYLYNTDAEKPTEIKSAMYTFIFGYNVAPERYPRVAMLPTFYHFIQFLDYINIRKRVKISLIAHNANKFDNHFVIEQAINSFDCIPFNAFQKNVDADISMPKKSEVEGNAIFEKRVRSMNSVEISDMIINGRHLKTIDTFPKTGASLGELGEMLLSSKLIEEEFTKDEMDYSVFNTTENLTYEQTIMYSEQIFMKLISPDAEPKIKHMSKYMRNDIIVLGLVRRHYSEIFFGFDFDKMTKTQNIKDAYLVNNLTEWQLLKTFHQGNKVESVPFSNYETQHGENLFEYFNHFYFGGLNCYNDNYVSTFIRNAFSMDLNSSYPYVMYHFKIPTFPIESFFPEQETEIPLELDNPEHFYFYEITRDTMNHLLSKVKSVVLRKMFKKYYTRLTEKNVYINTNTLRSLRDTGKIEISTLKVISSFAWECCDFGAKDKIAEFYFIKTQGKFGKKGKTVDFANSTYTTNEHKQKILISGNPTKVSIVDNNFDKSKGFSDEIVQISKVNLNGLYGLPALGAYFNLGYRDELGNIKLERNGFRNQERNVVFSAFVTSQAFYNLIEPLKYLTAEEIDDAFIYCDTDSLYLKDYIKPKIPKEIFNPMNLGAWDIEHDDIEEIYVLNHKKYAYTCKSLDKVQIRAGGINKKAFDPTLDFRDFVEKQFHHGVTIPAVKSLRNVNNTITIINSDTKLQEGTPYPEYYSDEDDVQLEKMKQELIEELDEQNLNIDAALYIESPLGSFSIKSLFPKKVTTKFKDINEIAFINFSEVIKKSLRG